MEVEIGGEKLRVPTSPRKSRLYMQVYPFIQPASPQKLPNPIAGACLHQNVELEWMGPVQTLQPQK